MSCSKIPGIASHFVSRTENGPILVWGWFLYDQLAKNGFYIFKGLRRKGIYDRSCDPPSFKYLPSKLLTSLFDSYYSQTGKWKVFPGTGQHNGFASCPGMLNWPNLVQDSPPQGCISSLAFLQLTSLVLLPLWPLLSLAFLSPTTHIPRVPSLALCSSMLPIPEK